MNNFNFLAYQPLKYHATNGLAWCKATFYFQGNNYYLYTCANCPQIKIEKGKLPKGDFYDL